MFGLTQREQRWKAEQKLAETLLNFVATVAVNNEIAELRAENTALRAELEKGKLLVAPSTERG